MFFWKHLYDCDPAAVGAGEGRGAAPADAGSKAGTHTGGDPFPGEGTGLSPMPQPQTAGGNKPLTGHLKFKFVYFLRRSYYEDSRQNHL